MAKQKLAKPSFREENGVIHLDDVGLSFNLQKVGSINFDDLRKADYGNGFRMSTMPELVPLVYASLENQDYASAKNVVKLLRRGWLVGNTGILYVPDGMYVQDNPNIRNGKISITQKTLQNKLGSHEEKGVVFSDDKSVRFTPYNFFRGPLQPVLSLSRNAGVIALVGGKENAEKLAKVSKHWERQSHFRNLITDSPQTRVPVLGSYYFGRLSVNADGSEDRSNWDSFGVCELEK